MREETAKSGDGRQTVTHLDAVTVWEGGRGGGGQERDEGVRDRGRRVEWTSGNGWEFEGTG